MEKKGFGKLPSGFRFRIDFVVQSHQMMFAQCQQEDYRGFSFQGPLEENKILAPSSNFPLVKCFSVMKLLPFLVWIG